MVTNMKHLIKNTTLKQQIDREKIKKYIEENKASLKKQGLCLAVADIFVNGVIVMYACSMGGAEISFNPLRLIGYGLFHSGSFISYLVIVVVTFGLLTEHKIKFITTAKNIDERKFEVSDTNDYDSSHFMIEEDKKKYLRRGTIEELTGNILGIDPDTGLLAELNPDLPIDELRNGNVFAQGGPGSKKSRSRIIPDILQCVRRGESMILLDAKGELCSKTSLFVESQGYITRRINFIDPIVSDSVPFLKMVGNSTQKAQKMATIIMANASGEDRKGGFWEDGEKALLVFAILLVALDKKIPDNEKTLGRVFDILVHKGKNIEELQAIADSLPAGHPAREQWDIFLITPENVRSSIASGLATKLQILNTKEVAAMTGYDEVDLEAPGKCKCAYYVMISSTDDTYQWLQALFFSFLFDTLIVYAGRQYTQTLPVKVNFLFDEFSKAGNINKFEDVLSVARSTGIDITMIVQSMGQVINLYGETTVQNMLSNCDIQMLLGTNEHQKNASYWSDREGNITIKPSSEKQDEEGESVSVSSGTGQRPLETIAEVMKMDRKEERVCIANADPLKLLKYDYSNHPYAKQLKIQNPIAHVPAWWSREEVYSKKWFQSAVKEVLEYNNEREQDTPLSFDSWKKKKEFSAKTECVDEELLKKALKESKNQAKRLEKDKKMLEKAEYDIYRKDIENRNLSERKERTADNQTINNNSVKDMRFTKEEAENIARIIAEDITNQKNKV